MRRAYCLFFLVIGIALGLSLGSLSQRPFPPRLALNGHTLDLSRATVADLNRAGFFLKNNDGALPAKSFKERLSYYGEADREHSMGGVSILNRGGNSRTYAACEIFEITAKARDQEGRATGLRAAYNGREFFGCSARELEAFFGPPDGESTPFMLQYRSPDGDYETAFYLDLETKLCYLADIHRAEPSLAR